jgi:hypothetical protein
MTDYKGMNVNERLCVSDLLQEFEKAAKSRDRGQMISMLLTVNLTPEQAASTTDAALANPKRYGF